MTPMRRKDREMDEAFALSLLANCAYATLSMSDGAGNPYAVPVSPVMEDRTVYIHCAVAGKKLELLARCPRVCLSCVGRTKVLEADYSMAYESAIALGVATLVEDAEERRHALRLICEKYAPTAMDGFDAYLAGQFAHTAVIQVDITSISGKCNNRFDG